MGAGRFVKIVKRAGNNRQGSLSRRWDTCTCHPQAWGLKKGLRRARRRVDKEIIRESEDG